MSPDLSRALIGLAVAAAALLPPLPVQAADFAPFHTACLKARTFLLHDLPTSADPDAVLAALCPCLEAGFAAYPQAAVDALEADLRTGSSYEAKATYPGYQALQLRASEVLSACFQAPAVTRLIPPAPPSAQ